MSLTLKQLKDKLGSVLDDTIDKELTDKIGRDVKKTIKNRTQKGFGVKENGGPKQRLKKIKKRTKEIRKELKAQGRLSGKTTPNRSNLTRTGKMLNNIGYSNSDNEVLVTLKGAEQDKARKVSKERPFMNLSKSEVKQVADIVAKAIIEDIKKKGL